MIQHVCKQCGKPQSLPDSFAGREQACPGCGNRQTVAASSGIAPTVTTAAAKPSVRTRRLGADLRQVQAAFATDPVIRLEEAGGEPPELFRFAISVRGVERLKSKQPIFRDQHRVEIQMPLDYPRLAPKCRMLTPIFHPNIDESAICVGDHWVAGEQLADLVRRIAEMIAYQAYNIKSPLNGEAAMWADLNHEQLPVDSRSIF